MKLKHIGRKPMPESDLYSWREKSTWDIDDFLRWIGFPFRFVIALLVLIVVGFFYCLGILLGSCTGRDIREGLDSLWSFASRGLR